MKEYKNRNHKLWLIIVMIAIGVLIVIGLIVINKKDSNQPKITEAQSVELAKKFYGEPDPGYELSKSYDLNGGWCYSMMPTNGEESTGGVMLCIDDRGQGYRVVSFMNYPVDGQSIYSYTSSLEQAYTIKPRFKGQKSWDIKVDL